MNESINTIEEGYDKQEVRNRLKKLKAELMESLVSDNDDIRNLIENMGVKDMADVAADDIDARSIDAFGARVKRRLQSIDAALVRLENNKFGICASCGKRIRVERIQAIPYAVQCIDCKTNSERRRQM